MKKLFTSLILLVAFAIPAFSNIYAIYTDKLPKDDAFKAKYQLFKDNYRLSDVYRPNWSFDKTKEEVGQELIEFNDYISNLKKPSYDVQLLKLISLRCLYNLDAAGYEEVTEYSDFLKKKYKKEYRTWWIYANFLSTTVLTNEAYKEIEDAALMINYKMNVNLLQDYIYICFLSRHLKRGWIFLNELANLHGTPVEEEGLYPLFAENLIFPELGDEFSKTEIWDIGQINKDIELYRLTSDIAGLSFYVNGDWNLTLNDFVGNQTSAIITPPQFMAGNSPVGITSLIIAQAGENSLEILTHAVRNYIQNPLKHYKKTIDSIEFDVYEYENKEVYKDLRNGARMIILLAKVPYSSTSGANLDASCSVSFAVENGNSPSFYRVTPKIDRIPGDVSYLFLLDTCNLIYDDSSEWFWDFMNGVIIE